MKDQLDDIQPPLKMVHISDQTICYQVEQADEFQLVNSESLPISETDPVLFNKLRTIFGADGGKIILDV